MIICWRSPKRIHVGGDYPSGGTCGEDGVSAVVWFCGIRAQRGRRRVPMHRRELRIGHCRREVDPAVCVRAIASDFSARCVSTTRARESRGQRRAVRQLLADVTGLSTRQQHSQATLKYHDPPPHQDRNFVLPDNDIPTQRRTLSTPAHAANPLVSSGEPTVPGPPPPADTDPRWPCQKCKRHQRQSGSPKTGPDQLRQLQRCNDSKVAPALSRIAECL